MATPMDTKRLPLPRAAAPRPARLTFDQFLLGQVPLLIAVVLIFGVIAYAARGYMPTGSSPAGVTSGGGAAPVAGATGGGPITAFTSEPVAFDARFAVSE